LSTPFLTKYNPKSSASSASPIFPVGLTYNPPASSPSPFETPDIFLPSRERKFIITAPTLPVLPPPLREIKPKTYHLSKDSIEKIARLRSTDPYRWNRKALATQFKCSKFFVGMIAEAPQRRKDDMDRRLSLIKSKWGLYKRTSRYRRQQRREMWASD
ncbi:mitochondrial ribosomal protein subunit L20-domain-containing protein, partial [Lipomyces arxii]|uniref:mitochondrial 54S ribosomal protein mL58 n=1 Tax=Lipomyces arxii TaxID=56418 RepID=UPI0034CD9E61